VRQLGDRKLLVVLDNCEHVRDGATTVIAAILSGCPGVAAVATSRVTLGVTGERVVRVPPMPLADAFELFLTRCRAGGVDVAHDAASREAARRICDRVDRLPLALELAAGWAGTLSLTQIADALHEPYELLDGGALTAPFRQRTLEESMRWSHELLDDDERALFRQLGVFEPDFTSETLVGLGLRTNMGQRRILRALRGLVDASLVVADTTSTTARYRMLGVVRAYALARLADADETALVRDHHLATHVSLVADLAPLLKTDKDAWRDQVGAMYANVRAAIAWGLSRDDPTGGRRLAAAIAWLWHLEGRGAEGVRLLRLASERGRGERSALQADVLVALALVLDTALPGEQAYEVARHAHELACAVGAPAAARLARSLTAIGRLAGGLDEALDAAVRARDDATAADDRFVADSSEALIGLIHLLGDDHRAAIGHLERALDGLLGRGDRGIASSGHSWLALAFARSGDLPRAAEIAERAVIVAQPLRDFHRTGFARSVLAEIRAIQGRIDDAVAALAPIDRLVADSDNQAYIPGWERVHALLALTRGDPREAVAWCRREGRLRDAPDDGQLTPETQLLLAAALREAGAADDATKALDALSQSTLAPQMPHIEAGVLDQRALLAHATDRDRARDLHHQALRIRVEHDLTLDCIASLESLAALALRDHDAEVGGLLKGAAERAREDVGAAAQPSLRELDGERAVWLTDPRVREALTRGHAMDLRNALAYATRKRGPRRRPSSGWQSLTPTERAVVELAVQGLSNPQIATRMFISRGTVKTHLAHVYAKLGVANRTELARLDGERRENGSASVPARAGRSRRSYGAGHE